MRELRHRLQRVFLTGKPIKEAVRYTLARVRPPSPLLSHGRGLRQDLYTCDKIFKELEDNDEMTLGMLDYSKIGKVVRRIGYKDDIPFEEKFCFRERAKVLVQQWSRLIGMGIAEYAKGSGIHGFSDMDAISPILHDMMRSRKRCVGTVGSLDEVIVEDASGRTTVVTLPSS